MKRFIGLIASIFIVTSLVSCSTGNDYQSADYSRICVDAQTHERVSGDKCGDENSPNPNIGFLWWFIPYGHSLPAYGYPVSGGRQYISKSAVVEHDERLAPKGGKSYTKAPTRSYSDGSGKKLGTTKGGAGYKPLPPKVNNPPKAPANKAPAGGGYKAPPKVNNAPKMPAPAPPRAPAPAPRAPAPVRIK